MEYGHCTLQAIEQIYSTQFMRIIINDLTSPIPIKKGERCLLSLFLFILSLEIMLIQIQADPDIKGLKTKKNHVKLQVFARGVVIISGDPLNSFPPHFHHLQTYGEKNGFKINLHKTYIVTKNMSEKQAKSFQQTSGFTLASKVHYLGIILTKQCCYLIVDNYV